MNFHIFYQSLNILREYFRFIFYKEDTPTLLIERTSTKIAPQFDIKSIDGVALYNAVHRQVLHGNEFNYSFEDKNISIKYKDDPRKLKVMKQIMMQENIMRNL